jgi:hypothetical protein
MEQGKEQATPQAIIEKVISKEEQQKQDALKQKRAEKAEQLLADLPMSED